MDKKCCRENKDSTCCSLSKSDSGKSLRTLKSKMLKINLSLQFFLMQKNKELKICDSNTNDVGVPSGLRHECGVFGAIGCGEWPTHVNNFYFFYTCQHTCI